jgi:murein DD-endopeptidase MepM/ murein hydrolase activator NlpD
MILVFLQKIKFMSIHKYEFNPETLDFEKKGLTKTQKALIAVLSVFVGGLLIFPIIFIIYGFYFEKRSNKAQQSEYEVLKNQYNELLKRKDQNDEFLQELIEKDKTIYKAVFKTLPENDMFEMQNPYVKYASVSGRTIVNVNNNRIEEMKFLILKNRTNYKIINAIIQSGKSADLKNIPSIQPVYNKNMQYPVYGYGNKIDQVYKSLIFHPGVDFAAPEGTTVFATANGKVESAGFIRGHGQRIVINHGNGYKTLYAHLDNINVFEGKTVERGDVIGTIGMTGKSIIPHLHYEVTFKAKHLNPVNFFFMDLNPVEFFKVESESARSGLSLD